MASPLSKAGGRVRLSATARVSASLSRLEDLSEARLAGIFTRFDARRVLAAARTVDTNADLAGGPLAGLTVAIKDLFDEAGEVTTAGSYRLRAAPAAERDAPAVARLKAAGAIPYGRTGMTEFAYSGVGLNPHYDTPGNAIDAARIPGGSTAGGGVAVGLGLCDAALGSDTGGSVRIPAAFNAIAGFKPSQASVPLEGAFPLSQTFDSIGPLAPRISTCAALYGALSQTHDGAHRESAEISRLKLGILRTVATDDLDEAVGQDFERALTLLSKAGATLTDVTIPALAEASDVNRKIIASEAYAIHGAYLEELESDGDPRVLKRITGGKAIDREEVQAARELRRDAVGAFATAASDYDAILAPTVAIAPPTIAEAEADFDRLNAKILRNPTLVNFVDGCAATVPMHRPGGLPTGLMIIGPNGTDWPTLGSAATIESALVERIRHSSPA